MGRLLLLLPLLTGLTGCVDGEVRELAPRDVRLGIAATAPTTTLELPPAPTSPAGALQGEPSDDPARLDVAGTWDTLLVRRVPDEGTLAWSPALPPDATVTRDGDLVRVHAPSAVGRTFTLTVGRPDGTSLPPAAGTLGGLPGRGDFPAWPAADACGDRVFPAQLADGHVGCRGEGALDTWRTPSGRSAAVRLTREGARPGTVTPATTGAALSGGPATGLVSTRAAASDGPDLGGLVPGGGPPARRLANASRLGAWRPFEVAAGRFIGDRPLRGRPASDGVRVALPRADRVEVGDWTGGARVQVPARPSDVEQPVAVRGRWLAIVEGPIGDETLRLHDLERRHPHAAPVGVRRPRDPVFAGPWLGWLNATALRVLSTDGGRSWTSDVAAAAGAPAAFDDWMLVARRGGGVHAVHLPTGLHAAIETGAALTELRGSGAGRFTTRQQPSPGDARLVTWDAAVRVFEEDGGASWGAPLQRVAGGHGGSGGVVPAGGARTIAFDPGPGGGTVQTWRSAGATSCVVGLDGGPTPPPAGEGWQDLAVLPPRPEARPADRVVTVIFAAAAGVCVADAVRFVPHGGPR